MFNQLTAIALLSLIIIYAWFGIDHSTTNTFLNSSLEIAHNLSYGYLASYIFYIVNIYLPHKKKESESTEEIGVALARIQHNLNEIKIKFSLDTSASNLGRLILDLNKEDNNQPFIKLYTDTVVFLMGYGAADYYQKTFDLPTLLPLLQSEELQKSPFPIFLGNRNNALVCSIFGIHQNLLRIIKNSYVLPYDTIAFIETNLASIPKSIRNASRIDIRDIALDPAESASTLVSIELLLIELENENLIDEKIKAVRNEQLNYSGGHFKECAGKMKNLFQQKSPA